MPRGKSLNTYIQNIEPSDFDFLVEERDRADKVLDEVEREAAGACVAAPSLQS
jgi:hypothetical protein